MFVIIYIMRVDSNMKVRIMSFREKIAWVSLVGIVIAFAPYFALVAAYRGPAPVFPLYSGGLLVAVTIMTTTIVMLGSIGAALTNLKDANAPADERDRGIAQRASAAGYAVLMPLLFFALASLFLGLGKAALANAVLGAIVIAEVVRCATEVVLYRKGA